MSNLLKLHPDFRVVLPEGATGGTGKLEYQGVYMVAAMLAGASTRVKVIIPDLAKPRLGKIVNVTNNGDVLVLGALPGDPLPPYLKLTLYPTLPSGRGDPIIHEGRPHEYPPGSGYWDLEDIGGDDRPVVLDRETAAGLAADAQTALRRADEQQEAVAGGLAEIMQTQAQAQQAVTLLMTGGGNTAGSVPEVGDLRNLNALAGEYAVVRDVQAAYQRQADGSWQAAVSLAPALPAARNALPDGAWRVDASRGAVLDVPACKLGRVRLNILARHTDAEADTALQNVMEIAVYDGRGVKISDTGLWEIPEPGWHEFALRPVNWAGGPLYVVVSSNNTTSARFGDAQVSGITTPLALPAPAIINPSTLAARAPAVSVAPDAPLLLRKNPAYNTIPTAVMGVGTVSSEPYGIGIDDRLSRSSDGGVTWVQQSTTPYTSVMPAGEFPIDLVAWEGSDGTLRAGFLLGHKGTLLKYDAGLAAWSLFTPPDKHPQAVGRPKNIELWTPRVNEHHLLYGEYTGHDTGEIAGDPYVFRYNLSDPVNGWQLSNEMGLSRHVHSVLALPLGAAIVALGDATMQNSDTGIGLKILEPGGIDDTPLGLDAWQKYSGFFGYNPHYPVDMVALFDASGYPTDLIMSSDRPGIHLLHCKMQGKVGRFNINELCYQPGADPTETCHSITIDRATGNVYYCTGETTDPGLYCAPPPYTRTVKIHDFPQQPTMFRACIHGNHLMMGNHRWSLVEFLPS